MAVWTRRIALKALSCAAAVAAWPGMAWSMIVQAFQTRTVEEGPPAFDSATGELVLTDGSRETYALVVDGLAQRPLTLNYAQLRALPQVSQTSDFHCVEGWSVLDVAWGGVRLREIVELAKPAASATHVVFHALGETGYGKGALQNYHECLPLADLLRPELDYLLALDLGGAPLPLDRGAPVRLVCPFDLAYKSIKFVARIEFTDAPQDGWWTVANPVYPLNAPVPAKRLRRKDPRG